MIKPAMVSNKITEEVFARCEFLIIDSETLSSATGLVAVAIVIFLS